MDISQPHDSFFRFVVSKVERAAGLVQLKLPTDIVQYLHLDTLKALPDTFVDAQLQNRYSDALFTVQTQDVDAAYLYFLMDHKSSPDPDVGMQLLRYYNQVWERHQINHKGSKLPPIIGIVIYHGSRTWNCGDHLKDRFDCPEYIHPYLPLFRYFVIDLSAMADDQIQGGADLKAALMLMKYIFHPQLQAHLPKIIRILKEARQQPDFLSFFEAFMLYLMKYLNQEHHVELEQLVQTEFPEEGERIMPSIADMLHEKGLNQGLKQGLQQGREEGREEGLELGLIKGIIKLLQVKFHAIPEPMREKIMAVHDQADLDAVMECAITAESLAQFEEQVKLFISR